MARDDHFLSLLRQSPSETFATSLYTRLSCQLQRRKRRNIIIGASGVAALALVLGAMSVPPVRASVLRTLKQVAGIQFEQTPDYPGRRSVTEIPQTAMALDIALSEFDLSLPAWAPQGYAIDETVQIGEFSGGNKEVAVTWTRPGKAPIRLEVTLNQYTLIVGPESVETLQVAGREIALWRGGWNYDEKRWDTSIPALTLSWSDDGIAAYHLMGMSDSVSVDELIQMVESVP